MYNNPNQSHEQNSMPPNNQPFFPPPVAPGYYPQSGPVPPVFGYPPLQNKNTKTYAVTSLILFCVGGVLHILGLIPYLGIFFGCIGLLCDIVAIVFLIMVVVSL